MLAIGVGAIWAGNQYLSSPTVEPPETEVPVTQVLTEAPESVEPVAVEEADEVLVADHSVFAEGEELQFKLIWKRLKIGTATVAINKNVDLDGEIYHRIVVDADTSTFKDKENIYFSRDSFLPVWNFRTFAQWGREEEIIEEYNQEQYSVTVKKPESDTEPVFIERGGPLNNVFCLLYRLRQNEDFADDWSLDVFLPTKDFSLKYKGISTVKVPAGTYEAHVFDGDPHGVKFWVSTDERRLPLKFRTSGLFSYEAVLLEASSGEVVSGEVLTDG